MKNLVFLQSTWMMYLNLNLDNMRQGCLFIYYITSQVQITWDILITKRFQKDCNFRWTDLFSRWPPMRLLTIYKDLKSSGLKVSFWKNRMKFNKRSDYFNGFGNQNLLKFILDQNSFLYSISHDFQFFCWQWNSKKF